MDNFLENFLKAAGAILMLTMSVAFLFMFLKYSGLDELFKSEQKIELQYDEAEDKEEEKAPVVSEYIKYQVDGEDRWYFHGYPYIKITEQNLASLGEQSGVG